MELEPIISLLVYLLVGAASAFLSGLLGVGGGLILVPSFVYIFSTFNVVPNSQLMHLSIGTSLASSIINLSVSTREHHRNKAVLWPVFSAMAPGVLIGALLLGPLIMSILNSDHLKIAFGLFCIFIFLQMFFQKKSMMEKNLPPNIVLGSLGIVIGSISTLLGIAGGAMIGALLHFYNINTRKIVGTTAAICIVIAIAGTLGLLIVGYHQTDLPRYSTGFIYWPAFLGVVMTSPLITPLGAALAHKLPVSVLKKLFAGLVLVIGAKMLWS